MSVDSIRKKIKEIHSELPEGVRLVAVSKFHPVEALQEAYHAGQRVFGESRVQEISAKYGSMPSDVEWHFIGHLQTNKVKHLVPYATLIHSIDSERLLRIVDEEARKQGRELGVLLQLHVAKEETKYGFSKNECFEMLQSGILNDLTNVKICGIMGMATNTDDDSEIRKEFRLIKRVYDEVKEGCFANDECFKEISMGMSDDYLIAIEEGSTLIRIGTSIFGEREY